jgi:hypothetical protein
MDEKYQQLIETIAVKLDDFMGKDSIDDLVDFVCDEYALDAVLHATPERCSASHLCDCQEASQPCARALGSNDRVEGRDAALSRRVPSHDGLEGNGTGHHE